MPKCRKCELTIGSEAESACQIVGCPRDSYSSKPPYSHRDEMAIRAPTEVIAMSAQIASEGIQDHAQFGKFTTRIMAEILLGNLDPEAAKTVSIFSRQLLDSLNVIHRTGRVK